MEVISAKIEKETKERMRKLPYINWSEVIREMLKARIEKEEARQRSIDRSMVRKGTELAGSVRRASKNWNSTEEIRKWRDRIG